MTQTIERPSGSHRAPEQVGAMGVTVGDIFYRSWGYDQTNVNYYIVVGLTKSGKSAKLREIGLTTVDDDGPTTHVVPDDTRFIDEGAGWCPNCRSRVSVRTVFDGGKVLMHTSTETKRCYGSDGKPTGTVAEPVPPTILTKVIKDCGRGEPSFAFNSYSSLFKWDGKPQYQTGFGYGH